MEWSAGRCCRGASPRRCRAPCGRAAADSGRPRAVMGSVGCIHNAPCRLWAGDSGAPPLSPARRLCLRRRLRRAEMAAAGRWAIVCDGRGRGPGRALEARSVTGGDWGQRCAGGAVTPGMGLRGMTLWGTQTSEALQRTWQCHLKGGFVSGCSGRWRPWWTGSSRSIVASRRVRFR